MNLRSLTVSLLAVGILLIGAGCAKAPGPLKKAPSKPAPAKVQLSADARAGAKIYVDYACIKCHGAQGKGGIKDPVRKQPIPGLKKDDAGALKSVLTNGIIVSQGKENGWINMPNWRGIINDRQQKQLAAWFSAGLPDAGIKPLPDKTGKDIYTAYACIKCHGDLEKGGIVNPVFPPGTDDHFVPTLGPKEFDARKYQKIIMNGSIPHHGVPTGYPGTLFMPAWGQLMTKEQVNNIMNYLKTAK